MNRWVGVGGPLIAFALLLLHTPARGAVGDQRPEQQAVGADHHRERGGPSLEVMGAVQR